MADSKITALTALTAADPINDMLPIVDVSDTTMAASGTTKKISVNNILGASGTATLASATITGDLTVDTSTLKVDSTNNRVGIGTASPATDLHVFKSSATDNALIQLQNGTASSYIGTRGTTYGAVDAGDTYIFNSSGNDIVLMADNAAGTIKFATGGNTESARFNSIGNLAFANGKGIDFSAVTGGTGTATGNVLNDYEEGTFTPTVVGTTADGTIGTYYAQSGRYTKVGRLVTVQVYLAYGGGTGATGDLAFAGLPFTTGNIVNNYTSGAIGYFGDIALTALNVPSLFASPNTTRFLVNQFPVGGGSLTAVPYDGSGAIMFTATYFTA